METNEPKKPKRPRIQQTPGMESTGAEHNSYDKGSYNADRQQGGEGMQGGYNPEGQRPYQRNSYGQGGYQPRQGGYNNNRQGGYNNYRQQGGYNNQRPYQQRPYQPRPQQAQAEGMDNGENTPQNQEGGYKPRNNYNANGGYNNNRQGGYNNNRQGGYNNNRQGGYGNNRQGGYGNNRQQGGYGNNRQQGGYGNNRQQGGYGNNRQQGGYNNRQGGYGNNRQGGYGNNRQGGYNNNRQGGYNNHNRQQGGPVRQGKSFTPRPKRIEYELPLPDPNEQIRLNKFMANAGICSRREADEFIQQGLVKVNGKVVTELGTKIGHDDTVEYNEKIVALESKCYILLNKPKDCVTTSDDPNGRTTVMDLVKGACTERIYPVGRLDRNTTGVLLLTNDGDLASKLTHPKYVKKKIYHVWTDKDIAEEDMQRIADGIELEDGPIHADAISYATDTDRNQAGIEIHSGRNRIVRRIFESLGYHVTKLDRVYFAGLTKKNLPRGRWRYLTQEEVNFLKMGSFE